MEEQKGRYQSKQPGNTESHVSNSLSAWLALGMESRRSYTDTGSEHRKAWHSLSFTGKGYQVEIWQENKTVGSKEQAKS